MPPSLEQRADALLTRVLRLGLYLPLLSPLIVTPSDPATATGLLDPHDNPTPGILLDPRLVGAMAAAGQSDVLIQLWRTSAARHPAFAANLATMLKIGVPRTSLSP